MTQVIFSHPFGNPNSYNAAVALHSSGKLSSFHTCLFAPLGSRYRFHPDLRAANIVTHSHRELIRLALSRVPVARSAGRSTAMRDWVAMGFDECVAGRVAERNEIVYGYEDFALRTFLSAKEKGLTTVYDLPTVHFQEAQAIAEAEVTSDRSLRPFLQSANEPQHRIERKSAEIKAADHIICASSFVAKSIQKHVTDRVPIHVIPYGAACNVIPKRWGRYDEHGPVKLLFVGALSPHKGIHHLFSALARIPSKEFRLSLAGVWQPGFREWLSARFSISYRFLGKVPHAEVFSICKQNDVLLFPSIQDGFGLVLLEAFASGIAVAASHNSGAPDFIDDGRNGFLFEAGSSSSLHSVIDRILHVRHRLPEIGDMARRTAEDLTWAAYRSKIANLVASLNDAASRRSTIVRSVGQS